MNRIHNPKLFIQRILGILMALITALIFALAAFGIIEPDCTAAIFTAFLSLVLLLSKDCVLII